MKASDIDGHPDEGLVDEDLSVADRIKEWREDDDEGYNSAIELICDAEEKLRSLAGKLEAAERRERMALEDLDKSVKRRSELAGLLEDLNRWLYVIDVVEDHGSRVAWRDRIRAAIAPEEETA